ncbi:MAG TPA: NAD-dependent epimerase/dehydratase family protein, partial [Thermoanaerobaculia bacterium]|nr:NAD-dependent epimerase/dehydratase family protein [Thermoanaerobaculia bacterium]
MDRLAGKRILVTGGLGFIGSSLAARLHRSGARVTLCDAMIPGYGGNPANVAEIRRDVTIDASDVRDE